MAMHPHTNPFERIPRSCVGGPTQDRAWCKLHRDAVGHDMQHTVAISILKHQAGSDANQARLVYRRIIRSHLQNGQLWYLQTDATG